MTNDEFAALKKIYDAIVAQEERKRFERLVFIEDEDE
jgi:hypothetical protein